MIKINILLYVFYYNKTVTQIDRDGLISYWVTGPTHATFRGWEFAFTSFHRQVLSCPAVPRKSRFRETLPLGRSRVHLPACQQHVTSWETQE